MFRTQISAAILITVMIGVTIWSAHDGNHGIPMMIIAAVGVFATMMVLGTLSAMVPETRLTAAIFAASWILLFTPAWEWLAGRFVYPDSLYSALTFAVAFGFIRYLLTRGGPSRPLS
jgi:hypothetical protein